MAPSLAVHEHSRQQRAWQAGACALDLGQALYLQVRDVRGGKAEVGHGHLVPRNRGVLEGVRPVFQLPLLGYREGRLPRRMALEC
jgi:hypothetical protein